MKWSGYLVALLIGIAIGAYQTTWIMCWALILAWVISVVADIIHPNEELQKRVEKFFFGDLGDKKGSHGSATQVKNKSS